MKKQIHPDIKRLEDKINLLNDKLDRLMDAQGVKLEKTRDEIDKEAKQKSKVRERQQQKIIKQQQLQARIDRFKDDFDLRYSAGMELRIKFNLLHLPSADRIREYLRTNDPKAFDGLKRMN